MTLQRNFLIILISCFTTIQCGAGKTDWQYMILTFNWTSTNEDVFATYLRPERIAPGLYGLSGTIRFGVQIDNSFMYELNVYRSLAGNNFVMTPYCIPNVPFEVLINMFYRPLAMKDLQKCSDFPFFKKPFKGTVGPVDFHLDKCMIPSYKLPSFVRAGYYKLVLKVSSPSVKLTADLVVQVHGKIF